jgi:AcrR family transcriptional regulator
VPRAGLDPAVVTAAAAELADEVGLDSVTMGSLAARLGVRAPSLYKHVEGQADILRRIAVQALTELGDALRDALQGRAGRAALVAAADAFRTYATEHPGRYAATVRVTSVQPGDPLAAAGTRVFNSLAVVLDGSRIDPADTIHALRMLRSLLHGFATLESSGVFQLDTDVDDSFAWLVGFLDRGLTS